jgi:hypothetical protein
MAAVIDALFFLIRHTPFWAIPGLFIFGHYGYIYWLKGIKDLAVFMFALNAISFLFLAFYIWEGGPERATKTFLLLVKGLV